MCISSWVAGGRVRSHSSHLGQGVGVPGVSAVPAVAPDFLSFLFCECFANSSLADQLVLTNTLSVSGAN